MLSAILFTLTQIIDNCQDVRNLYKSASCCADSTAGLDGQYLRIPENCSLTDSSASMFYTNPQQMAHTWGREPDNRAFAPSTLPEFTPNGIKAYDVFAFDSFPGYKLAESMTTPVADLEYVYYLLEVWDDDQVIPDIGRTVQAGRVSGSKHVFGPPDGGKNILAKQSRATGKVVKWILPPPVPQGLAVFAASRGPVSMVGDYLYVMLPAGIGKFDKDLNMIDSISFNQELFPEMFEAFTGVQKNDPIKDNEIPNTALEGYIVNSTDPFKLFREVPVIPRHLNAFEHNGKAHITLTVLGLGYSGYTAGELGKFNEFYQDEACGLVFMYVDSGSSFDFKWKFRACPDYLKEGDLLPETSFRIDSGEVAEEVEFFWIMHDGMVFQDGGADEEHEYGGIATTSGVHRLIGAEATQRSDIHVVEPLPYSYTAMWFHFTDGEVFDSTKMYDGYSNPELTGTPTKTPGTALLQQPFFTKLYKTMIGKKPLSRLEASQLNHHGASFYGQSLYDAEKNVVILGTGNGQRSPEGITRHAFGTVMGVPETSHMPYSINTVGKMCIGEVLGMSLEQVFASRDLNALLTPEKNTAAIQCFHRLYDSVWNVNYGGRYNRYMADSYLALDVDTGALKWHFKFTPWDEYDHNTNGNRGFYQELSKDEANKAVEFHGDGSNGSGGPGCMFADPFEGRKYLLCFTKYRPYILDYENMFGQMTHVSGETDESDPQYIKGIQTNTVVQNAMVWAETTLPQGVLWTIGGHASNGRQWVVKNNNVWDWATDASMHDSTTPAGKLHPHTTAYDNGAPFVNFMRPSSFFSATDSATEFLTKEWDLEIPPTDRDFNFYPAHVEYSSETLAYGQASLYGYDAFRIIKAQHLGNGKYKPIDYSPITIHSPTYSWYVMEEQDRYAFSMNNLGIQIYGDVLVAGQKNGDLSFYDVQTGELKKRIQIPGGTETPPAIVDGIVYGATGGSKHSNALGTFERYDGYFTGQYIYMLTPFGK